MSDQPTRGGGSRRSPDPNAIIGAGSRAYGWLRKVLTVYGTAVTVAQLVPAAIALVVVFVSPTAWLSATLRRWVGLGALVGTVIGVLVLARVAVPLARRALRDGGAVRARRLAAVAWWGLMAGVVSAAAFRLHLAVVDVAFVQSVPFLTPVLDFYLGGGPGAATAYNLIAACLAALALAGVVAGAPAALLRWRERRKARQALFEEGGPMAALEKALEALDQARAAVERSKDAVLHAAEAEGPVTTSATARQDLPAPRAALRRSPR